MASGSGRIHEKSGAEPVYWIRIRAETVPSWFCVKMIRSAFWSMGEFWQKNPPQA